MQKDFKYDIHALCVLLFGLMCALRADDVIRLNWVVIAAPLFLPPAIEALVLDVRGITKIVKEKINGHRL